MNSDNNKDSGIPTFSLLDETFYSSDNLIEQKKKPDNDSKLDNSYNNIPAKSIVAKILVVGDVSVGKTSLVNRLTLNKFEDVYKATIGTDFMTVKVFKEGYNISLNFWDIAGSSRPRDQPNVFYKGASLVLCVADIMNAETYHKCLIWKAELDDRFQNKLGKGISESNIGANDDDNNNDGINNVPIIFIANKFDICLTEQAKADAQANVNTFRKDNEFVFGTCVSAKNTENIEELKSVIINILIAQSKAGLIVDLRSKARDLSIVSLYNEDDGRDSYSNVGTNLVLNDAKRGGMGCGC